MSRSTGSGRPEDKPKSGICKMFWDSLFGWNLQPVGERLWSEFHGMKRPIVTVLMTALVAVGATYYLMRKPRTPTPETIQAYVREWFDTFSGCVQRMPDNNAYFFYTLDWGDGVKTDISRNRSTPQDITWSGKLWIGERSLSQFDALSSDQKEDYMHDMSTAMAEHKMPCSFKEPYTVVNLARSLPIASLTGDKFREAAEEIHADSHIWLM